MGVAEIHGSAFDLYRRNFFKLGLINLVQVIGTGVFLVAVQVATTFGDLSLQCFSLIAQLLFYVVINLVAAAALVATSNAVLGRPVSFRGAYSRVLSTQFLGKLTVAATVAGLAVSIGLLLLIIPGLVFSIWFAFVPFVVTLEKRSGRAALGRSRELVQGNFWRVLFGYIVLCFVPLYVILIAAINIVASALGLTILDGMPYQLVTIAVSSLFALLLAPYLNLVLTLFYYDLRARKENYNEELLAQDMGYKPLGEMVTV
jgi:hypothetical protein